MTHILVVDDSADNRYLLRRMLEINGYTVCEAADGQSALDCLQGQLPSVVLIDLNMPILNGWETTQRIKACTTTSHIPVIAVTGYVGLEAQPQVYSMAYDVCLSKPVDYQALLDAVEQCMTQPQAA